MSTASQLAQQLLRTVKKGEATALLQRKLQQVLLPDLEQGLPDDDRKKTFWINVYNAYFQILRLEQNLRPPEIYQQRVILLAGEAFSLDDIEHGILRKYQYKRAPEQFSKVFKPQLIKSLAVDKVDGRIHFTLNCGAESCPPIAFYREAQIAEQLALATASFLETESVIDSGQKIITTTALLDWYARDFGGEPGVRNLLESTLAVDLRDFKLKFREYSWKEKLGAFA